MDIHKMNPRVFHILEGESLDVKHTDFGSVGKVFSGHGIETVWVSKLDEEIDPEWFSQKTVDLILVLQGQLHVEFEDESQSSHVLTCGDLLVFPPNISCRAYRWLRETTEATFFFAVYPKDASGGLR